MAAHRVNMSYSMREDAELVQNEGSDLEDFLDSGSKENIVDSGEEFMPVDLEKTRVTAIITSSFSSLGSIQPVE